MTATATVRMREEIADHLNIPNCIWSISSFARPNLQFIVKAKNGVKVKNEIVELLKGKYNNVSGIIYCSTRDECDKMSEYLQQVHYQSFEIVVLFQPFIRETLSTCCNSLV